MNKLFDITGKVVVITGGTGVLGKAIAKYLALEGAKVVILGRRAEAGNAIVADIKEAGGEAMFLVTDVMKQDVLEQNLADIVAAYGRVDSLLNAAGGNMPGATIAPTGTFFDLKPEEFQKVLDLNLTGTVIPSQVFLTRVSIPTPRSRSRILLRCLNILPMRAWETLRSLALSFQRRFVARPCRLRLLLQTVFREVRLHPQRL